MLAIFILPYLFVNLDFFVVQLATRSILTDVEINYTYIWFPYSRNLLNFFSIT